jgi:hypothetical protein
MVDTSAPAQEVCYRAFVFHNLKAAAVQKHGAEAWRRVEAALPPESRPCFEARSRLPVAWLPAVHYARALALLTAQLGRGLPEEAVEWGRLRATLDINAFFKFVLGFASPDLVLQLASTIWGQYANFGPLAVQRVPGRGADAQVQMPLADPFLLHDLGGAMLAFLAHSKARNPRLTRCTFAPPATLSWVIAWD